MSSFIKYFFAALLAIFAFIMLTVLFFVTMAAVSGDSPVAVVEENSILHLTFDGPIPDRKPENELGFDLGTFQAVPKTGLNRILKDIAKAKIDDNIKGIYIDTRNVMAGTATLQEIREALVDFKNSGKWIVSYSDIMSQSAYYLASAGDEVYLQPEGSLEIKGLSANVAFMRDALDKAGVKMHVIRPKNNRFKSAVEPYLLDSMSASNEEQVDRFLTSLWSHMATEMAASRGMSETAFNEAVGALASRRSDTAVESGLIDGAKYADEVASILREKTGKEADEELEFVGLADYDRSVVRDFLDLEKVFEDDRIAVIYATGEIGMDEGGTDAIGTDLAGLIADARKDSSVKAIVLRINSPGGSALTSDIIWRETQLAKQAKPLVASMGNVAASGGYYIACEADKIFASENTITGSIGAFGTIPDVSELSEEMLGIHFDGVKTHRYADLFEINRPLREDEKALFQDMIDEVYMDFTTKVAEGRGRTQAYIDSIGQGRVWSGSDAMEIGLIDEFGGLDEAIMAAAELAGLNGDFSVRNFPKDKDPFEQLMEDMGANIKTELMSQVMTPEEIRLMEQAKTSRRFMQMQGAQLHMPYLLEIK